MQTTITVNNKKVKIVSQAKTRSGNLCGWNVDIDGKRYFSGVIRRCDAVDRAYAKWVDEHVATDAKAQNEG